MTECFADAFYFLALVSPTDEAHEPASQFATQSRRFIVTTTWVLTEVADGLANGRNRALFAQLLAQLRHDPRARIVETTDELFEAGVRLYESRPDKQWSLTDCISFVVMQNQGITDALTGDHHFEQAGFVALLKT